MPGQPDLVFEEEKFIIFFNGCYWHSHHCQEEPKTFYWQYKHSETRQRDKANNQKLNELGYTVHEVWECKWEKDPDDIISIIKDRLLLAQSRLSRNKIIP